MLPKRQSIGIACCRYNPKTSKPEILLVQKRYSYNFQAFVFGHYYPYDDKSLMYLFDGMTLPEKLEILSGKYDLLWYKIYLKIPKISSKKFCHENQSIDPAKITKQHNIYKKKNLRYPERLEIKTWKLEYKRKSSKFNIPDSVDYRTESCFYCKQKYKYDKLFENRGRIRLLDLINCSKSESLVWEIPKGRKGKGEGEISCAIREFEEETFIQPQGYKIIMKKPVSTNHIDQKICYVYKYYVAAYDRDYKPKICFGENITALTEIIDMKWISLHSLYLLESNTRLYKLCSIILKLFKNKVKNRQYTFNMYKLIENTTMNKKSKVLKNTKNCDLNN